MASAIYNQAIINWIDKNGAMSDSFWTVQAQDITPPGFLETLGAAVQACSDAAVIGVQFQSSMQIIATPGSGPYCTVRDRARMLARIVGPRVPTRQEIVGPKAEIFLPDLVTVDLTNPNIINLNEVAQAYLGDKLGNPQGPYYRGIRAKG